MATTYRVVPTVRSGIIGYSVVGTDPDGKEHVARYCGTREDAERIASQLDGRYGPAADIPPDP